jgi:hypothetical protein
MAVKPDLKPAETVYNTTLKNMLGVRGTTCNDIAIAESGECGARGYIRNLQMNFVTKMLTRDTYRGSYLERVVNLAQAARCQAGIVLRNIIEGHYGDSTSCRQSILQAIQASDSSRRVAYRTMNPTLDVHPVYRSASVPEFERIAFTRFRLCSHYLRYETGRWARIAPENRICPCGSVQTDVHVLLRCELSRPQRLLFNVPEYQELSQLFDLYDQAKICAFCKAVMDIYT